ncbi:uncharacterized protein LOC128723628 [Anopheles nili]|uniref:uncharacterized protein LOC128723628 n=1 Tax=Anopheles nili TaxID=185578 RepID=UPI00237C2AE6|nr:uncharacterized protein LOC128723628 [Anopheles nili]
MLTRTIGDDFRVMPYNLRILAIFGLEGNRSKQYRLVIFLVLVVLFLFIPKPLRITERYSFELIVRSLSEIIFTALFSLTAIIVASKSETYRELIFLIEKELTQFKDQHNESSKLIVKINTKIHRFSMLYTILHINYSILYNVVPTIYNIFKYFTKPKENLSNAFVIPLIIDFYGMDIEHNILHYAIFWITLTPLFLVVTAMLWFKGTLFILIRYNTLLYQLVIQQLQQHDKEAAGMQLSQKHQRLQDIVQLHCSAIKCTKLLNVILGLILLIQFVGCLLVFCLMMFYISRNKDMSIANLGVLFTSVFTEIMFYSYLGGQLTDKNSAISETAFGCRWYDEPIAIQRYYLRIIQQSQRNAAITIGKFNVVNIETFTQLVKASCTYFMVMKELF